MQTSITDQITVGSAVLCLAGDIDHGRGKGAIGEVTGFARLSSYHNREAFVSFGIKPEDSGWFWLRDLAAA